MHIINCFIDLFKCQKEGDNKKVKPLNLYLALFSKGVKTKLAPRQA